MTGRVRDHIPISVRSNSSLRFGLGLLAFLVAFSILAWLFLEDPKRQDLENAYAPPGSWPHLFGTDALGRDVLTWSAAGIRSALTVSVSVAILSALVGVLVGLVAGYFGGATDAVLMRLVDLELAIPPLLLFIAASVVVGGGMINLILLLTVVGWVTYARVVRTRILVERERAYVSAARLAGARIPHLLFVQLLPSATTLVLVLASLQAGVVLLWESGLSFLGLGLQPPTISLGFIVAAGRRDLVEAWWIVTFPGLIIVALVLAFNLIGDGLRDVFNVDVKLQDR